MKNIAILGSTGAVGGIAKNYFKDNDQYKNLYTPSSRELNLNKTYEFSKIQEKSLDLVILSIGSYKGLKGYINKKEESYKKSFYLNQKKFCQKYLKKGGLVINISSAVLQNENNFLNNSPYLQYSKEKKLLEESLNTIRNINIIHLRPTNILSNYENLHKSKHVFASMIRLISSSENICELWTNCSDWREFTSHDLLNNCLDAIVTDYALNNLPSERLILPIGSGIKTNIVSMAESISSSLNKKNISFVATQPSRPGPNLVPIGTSILKEKFPHFIDPGFNLDKVVGALVKLYNIKK